MGPGPAVAAWLWLMPVLLLLALVAVALAGNGDRPSTAAAPAPAPAPAAPADKADTAPNRGPDVLAVIEADPRLAQLANLLPLTGLADAVGGAGPFTVFAPNDAAVAALGATALDALRQDPALAQRVLAHHVVRGRAGAADLRPGGSGILTALDGAQLTVSVNGGRLEVGGATVVEPDGRASNGVVHVVDTVIVPPGVRFPEPPPPPPPPTERRPEPALPPTAAGTVVDVVRAAGRFAQFAALIDRSGLAGTLGDAGPYTVFAPTDEAFARVPKDQLDALAADPAATARLVEAHVTPGAIAAADLVAGPRPTLADSRFTVTFEAGKVHVAVDRDRPATIVGPDLGASNGMVHVIDRVLLPPPPPG